MSARSIDEQVERLLPLVANDETEMNNFVDLIYPFIKTSDSNVRNDVSQGIKEYKDKNPIVEPTKQTKTTEGDVNKDLLARLEALEKKNMEAEKALQRQSIKRGLSEKIKELGVKNDKWINAIVENTVITDDFNIEEKATNYLELYNSMQANIDPSITPTGTGGSKTDYISDAIKSAAAIAKQQNLI